MNKACGAPELLFNIGYYDGYWNGYTKPKNLLCLAMSFALRIRAIMVLIKLA